ncbi:Carboxylesterase [Candidatus Methylobacter favarea]|uniref:Pimeloyl-[acyl-carrier protein] methyl ester esterase n=1 Tax=Candidatus Methylobacter favarea TaxID=2707345 RepID=A0A8S0WIA8_9GAMM|nr:pimeloyl-ACP methyl ester esterase BioH [Candidatus Methylobacter favarea]CAA9890434.1 Carboxylesterase [Candidatus Methylobacter favarea]
MLKIYRETFGKGKPIVMVHGWAMHSGIWRSFIGQLAQHYKVTCIDLPGHGRSEKIEPFTLEQISTALVNVVSDEPICWLGWSLGATVVLDIANWFPDRCRSLILLTGNPCFTQKQQWPGMDDKLLDIFADNLNKNCRTALLRFLTLQVNNLPGYKVLLKELEAAINECDIPDSQTLQDGLKILKQSDLRPVLSKIAIPVASIFGNKDILVPVAVGQKMQQLLPAMELNIIDKAGHVPFLSHQQEVLSIISRFME